MQSVIIKKGLAKMIKVEKKNNDYITQVEGNDFELIAEVVVICKALVDAGMIPNLTSIGNIISDFDGEDFESKEL